MRSRAVSGGKPTSVARAVCCPRIRVSAFGRFLNGHAVGARGDDTLVQIMPGDPLPDHTPAIDDSAAALASPYAAEF